MTTLRRILIGAALAALACGIASANSITYQTTYGYDPTTGNYTVTQTGTLTGVSLNVSSPTSLFSFGSFASLGIGGGATYVNGDSTFDYEFTNSVTQFQITNNDQGTDTINASVQSLLNVDSGTTMPNSTGSGDRKSVGVDLGFGFNVNTPLQQVLTTAQTGVGGVTLTAGQTYVYSPLPVVTTVGIGYNACSSFGNVEVTSGCNQNLTSSSYATTGFTYGLTDTQQFADSLVGSGLLNLNIQATTNYSAMAEVTYEYSVPPPPSGTPEPATMALMGGALIGLGLIGKRLKKN
jgi:hypothetical protein